MIVKEGIKAVSCRFFSRLRIWECGMIRVLSVRPAYRGRYKERLSSENQGFGAQ